MIFRKKKEDKVDMAKDKKIGDDFDPTKVAVPEGYVVVKKDDVLPKSDFDKVMNRLDAFDAKLSGFSVAPSQPAAPPAPSGPTLDEQLTEIAGKIQAIDAQIDEAVKAGNPISELNRQRDALTERRNDLRFDAKINRVSSSGMHVIGELTDEVVGAKMPYLKLPEVKAKYDQLMGTLDPTVRSSPALRMEMYKLAIGHNYEAVRTYDTEEANRKAAEEAAATQTPGSSGRQSPGTRGDGELPTFEEVFGKANVREIQAKGLTTEQWCRKFARCSEEDYIKKALTMRGEFEGGQA